MCWCNPNLRTPCCGGFNCHPCSSNISNNTKLNISEPLGKSGLTLLNSETGDEILKQSSLVLWQNYCDKKQEVETLREMLKGCSTLLTEGTQEDCYNMAHDIYLYLREEKQ